MPLGQGTFIGPYEVVDWLGAGGMGEVYRARDARVDREVAIKLLPSKYALDAARLRRFAHEARAAGRLSHPNVLTVHDVGSLTGIPYVVSEVLDGETLRQRLRRGAISPARSAEYARQTANGLAAAHERGIVHRDIKPEGLFITRDDRVKILDFGFAKLLAPGDLTFVYPDARSGTSSNVQIGTSAYMSPEQLRGESVDARSDIFNLGAVLHEMLSGRPAFAGGSVAETSAAILGQDPAPLQPPVPQALSDIVRRCLEKRRESRFQSARDLAFALDLIPPSTPVRAPAPPPRSWRRYLLSASLALLLLAPGAALLRRPAADIDERFRGARFERLTDWNGTEGQAQISPDGRLVAFIADRDGPLDLWTTKIGSGRFQNLTSGVVRFPTGGATRTLAFNADASLIWLTTRNGSSLMPATGGTPNPFLGPHSAGAAWSPDGSRLTFFKDTEGDPLFVADSAGANAHQIFVEQRGGSRTRNPAWSPDGSWIYFVHGRSVGSALEMDVWRVRPTGESAEKLTDLKTALDSLAPIGDRTLLYVAPAPDRSGPWLWALDVPSRRTHRLVSGLDQYRSVSASRDGRRIVATVAGRSTDTSDVVLIDLPQ
jgi:serine/threonine protein kinase